MPGVVVIVPDVPYECLIRRIETDHNVIDIGSFHASVHRIPTNDPGVRKFAHERAREERRQGSLREDYALAVLDHHGSGARGDAASCASDIELNLSRVTFSGCCKAICVDPEIEVWLLAAQQSFASSIGLPADDFADLLSSAQQKHPADLSRQVRLILKRASVRNQDRYELRDVIEHISLPEMTTHPSFQEMADQFRSWFPA